MKAGAISGALRLQRVAARKGFDWDDPEGLWRKLAEEIAELRAAAGDRARSREELGDLLFMVINLARHLGVDPSQALAGANAKFRKRFAHILRHEAELPPQGHPQRLERMEALWQAAKAKERPARRRVIP